MKKESLYFQAIAEAAAGRLDIEIIESSLYKARRAANREEYALAARHYEGVFQIWEVYFAAASRENFEERRLLILPVLSEYMDVLRQLRREKRLLDVQAAMTKLT